MLVFLCIMPKRIQVSEEVWFLDIFIPILSNFLLHCVWSWCRRLYLTFHFIVLLHLCRLSCTSTTDQLFCWIVFQFIWNRFIIAFHMLTIHRFNILLSSNCNRTNVLGAAWLNVSLIHANICVNCFPLWYKATTLFQEISVSLHGRCNRVQTLGVGCELYDCIFLQELFRIIGMRL